MLMRIKRSIMGRGMFILPPLIIALLMVGYFHYSYIFPTYLHVFHAGSLTIPFEEFARSFERKMPSVKVANEAYGSLEAVRQVVELGRKADVVAVSDYGVIESLMMPEYADWYVIFATNEFVIAYTSGSRYANEISAFNWYKVLLREDVRIGRADPNTDPAGYRTLMVWKLAEKYYDDPGLYERFLEKSPEPTMPKEFDLISLLELGEIDYAFFYLSLAIQRDLEFIKLPGEVNLGDPSYASLYSTVNVTLRDGVEVFGTPIMYAITIPKGAPHLSLAVTFVELMLSEEGRYILRVNGQEPLTPALAKGLSRMPEQIQPYAVEWVD